MALTQTRLFGIIYRYLIKVISPVKTWQENQYNLGLEGRWHRCNHTGRFLALTRRRGCAIMRPAWRKAP